MFNIIQNKFMKRMMTIYAIALATTLSTWAQDTPQNTGNKQVERRQNNNKQAERMLATLELDKEQKKAFKEINKDYAVETKKLKKEYSDDKATLRSKAKKLNTARDAKIETLLSKEQHEKYTQMIQKRKEK